MAGRSGVPILPGLPSWGGISTLFRTWAGRLSPQCPRLPGPQYSFCSKEQQGMRKASDLSLPSEPLAAERELQGKKLNLLGFVCRVEGPG